MKRPLPLGTYPSILKRLHILHIFDNHECNLECNRVIKDTKIQSRALHQLVKPVNKGIAVNIQLTGGFRNIQGILKEFIDR